MQVGISSYLIPKCLMSNESKIRKINSILVKQYNAGTILNFFKSFSRAANSYFSSRCNLLYSSTTTNKLTHISSKWTHYKIGNRSQQKTISPLAELWVWVQLRELWV